MKELYLRNLLHAFLQYCESRAEYQFYLDCFCGKENEAIKLFLDEWLLKDEEEEGGAE